MIITINFISLNLFMKTLIVNIAWVQTQLTQDKLNTYLALNPEYKDKYFIISEKS